MTKVSRKRKFLQIFLIIIIVVISGTLTYTLIYNFGKKSRVFLTIEGNSALSEYCTLGSGTTSEPYIIENLHFESNNKGGIVIIDTDAPLLIRNCEFTSMSKNPAMEFPSKLCERYS